MNTLINLEQLESIKKYLEFYLDITPFEEMDWTNYHKYLKAVAKKGIELLLEKNEIPDLKFITTSILKTDNVLIPVCVLENLIKDNKGE